MDAVEQDVRFEWADFYQAFASQLLTGEIEERSWWRVFTALLLRLVVCHTYRTSPLMASPSFERHLSFHHYGLV